MHVFMLNNGDGFSANVVVGGLDIIVLSGHCAHSSDTSASVRADDYPDLYTTIFCS